MSDATEESRSRGAFGVGMGEATRLTREGRLAEATALIRRTLGGVPAADVPAPNRGSVSEPIEAAFRVAGAPAGAGGPPVRDRAREGTTPAAGTGSLPPDRVPRPRTAAHRSAPGAGVFAPERRPVTPQPGGQFVSGNHAERAGTRAYKLYIPSSYRGQGAPLIVMLHGCSQDPDDFAAGTRMNALAEREGFLVAYPAQAPSANGSKCWNWFKAGDQRRGTGEPAIIAGITRRIMGEYRVDAGRVYIAGMSAGAAMAVIVAEGYPELYAAVGAHSGLARGAAHDLPSALAAMRGGGPAHTRGGRVAGGTTERIVPTIVFHGDRDTTVDKVNADRVLERWAGAVDGRVTTNRGRARGGRAYTRSVYHDAGGRPVLERWIVAGAGHAWSGGSPAGSYTDPQGPDASAEMVRFFLAHPRE